MLILSLGRAKKMGYLFIKLMELHRATFLKDLKKRKKKTKKDNNKSLPQKINGKDNNRR